MCEDQGMAIVPWAALGGGELVTAEERKQREKGEQDPGARKPRYSTSEGEIKICEALEQIAKTKSTTLRAVVRTKTLHYLIVIVQYSRNND
jgi:aryl-alcohol dehydrogenase-like predicted oxidoreductase